MFRFLAVSLASGLALAAEAHAQDADDDGMDCVYNELVDSYELVAEALLYGDLGAEELAKSKQAVEAATARCDARYSYSADQAEVAAELGQMGSAIDYLSEELLFADVSEAAISPRWTPTKVSRTTSSRRLGIPTGVTTLLSTPS